MKKVRVDNKVITLPDAGGDCDTEVLKLPIFVVCQTNHALDRFLEGVLEFTKKVIRVDGQSCHEVMKNFSSDRDELGQLRKQDVLESLLNEKKHELEECNAEIEHISREKKCIEQAVGILRLAMLNKVMHPNHRKYFPSDEDFQVWLFSEEEDPFDVGFSWGNSQVENCKTDENVRTVDFENGEEDTLLIQKDNLFGSLNDSDVSQLECSEYFSLTVHELGSMYQEKIKEHESMKENVRFDLRNRVHRSENHGQIQALQADIRRLKRRYELLKNGLENPNYDPRCSIKALLLRHPLKLTPRLRWVRYWFWILQLREHFANRLNKLEELQTMCRNKIEQYKEHLLKDNLRALQQADVVGVTTAGAAGLNLALKSLEPAIGMSFFFPIS